MWTDEQITEMRASLLRWYDQSGRTLPWRIRPEDRNSGLKPDPYAIWLSEIMLQQTTVPHGTPYWFKFLELYPTVHDLAAAPLDEVLTHWVGLGYYARARNLHKCAKIVSEEMDGQFPQTKAALLKLPGIGDYTASTLAAICFDEPTSIVDGNVERVIARLHRVDTPLPKGKKEIKALARVLADPDRPGDYGQALMDLGATVCTPRSPNCDICVWWGLCEARKVGDMEAFPKKAPKKAQPVRYGHAYVMTRNESVWLRRRDEAGLLGGMMEVPTSDWLSEQPPYAPPIKAKWSQSVSPVRHIFTHFELRLDVHKAALEGDPAGAGEWVPIDQVKERALPTLFKKVLTTALGSGC